MIINDTVTVILACIGLSVILVILMQLLATILNLLWFVGDTRFNKKQKLKSKTKNFEILQGEWIKFTLGDFDFVDRYKCSLCDNIVLPATNHIDNFLYCSHCGAKMNGERKCDNENPN